MSLSDDVSNTCLIEQIETSSEAVCVCVVCVCVFMCMCTVCVFVCMYSICVYMGPVLGKSA